MEKTYTITLSNSELNNVCAGLGRLNKSLRDSIKNNEKNMNIGRQEGYPDEVIEKFEFRINFKKMRMSFVQDLLDRLNSETGRKAPES